MSYSASHPIVEESRTWHLGRVSRRIVAELADTLLPEEGRTERVRRHIVRYVDDWVPYLPVLFRKTFPIGLFLLQWGTVLSLIALKPFTLVRRANRLKYIRQWEKSPIPIFRALVGGVRGLIMSAYYAMPSVYRRIGYEPDDHVEACKRKRAELLAERGDADTHTASMIFENIGRRDGTPL